MKLKHLALALAALLSTPLLWTTAAEAETIKVGVTGGPHAEIMEAVKAEAAKSGLDIKIVEFADYIQPNAALAQGDLDANSYQHQPFLDQQVADRGYKLVSVAKTVVFPMGLYSKKIKTLAEIPNGAQIGIPNDPTNGGRALLLLEQAGVFKLDPTKGLKSTSLDIIDNPKKVKIVEIEAPQLPRTLDDLTGAVINTNYALTAGLSPSKDAIVLDGTASAYANVLAVQVKDKDKPWVRTLIAAYHSDSVKAFIDTKYQKAAIPAW
jgi:D-methionine transport system substrate-binding protein